MAGEVWSPSSSKMAMVKPYTQYQDIINGIASGKVNFQNYEDLLKALGIRNPEEYALAKNLIEEALKYSARNFNIQQANAVYPSIANASNLSNGLGTITNLTSGLGNIIRGIQATQAAKQQGNPSAVRQIQDAIRSIPADVAFEVLPQIVKSSRGNNVKIDPNAPSKLAELTDLLFPLSPQVSENSEDTAITTPSQPSDTNTLVAPYPTSAVATASIQPSDTNNLEAPYLTRVIDTTSSESPREGNELAAPYPTRAVATTSSESPRGSNNLEASYLAKAIDTTSSESPRNTNTLIAPYPTSASAKTTQAEKPTKTSKKEEGLQKITSDISTSTATTSEKPKTTTTTERPKTSTSSSSKKPKVAKTPAASTQIARPDYTNDAYGSQAQPVEPIPVQSAEPVIDESYYRYLRNNGWNDFDARRQAIRYY